MKSVIKIDKTLFEAAREEARAANRSATSQIERWAEIGRSVEHSRKLTALRFERSLAETLSPAFRNRVATGEFEKYEFTYVGSAEGKGYVDKLFRDGTRVTGKLQNGVFVECEHSKRRSSS